MSTELQLRYGDLHFWYRRGSLSIARQVDRVWLRYRGTDRTDAAHLGRGPTIIACTLIARSRAERVQAVQLLHSEEERELEVDGELYQRVTPDDQVTVEKVAEALYEISARFYALDPIPYDPVTGERLY